MQKKSHKRSLCVNTFETYQNPEIKKELTERGFCVYEYLDSKEFSDSIELKYLQWILRLKKIGLLLGIALFVLLWVSPLSAIYISLLIVGVHVCLLLWLCIAIFEHLRYFWSGRYVIYTPKGIMIGKKFFDSPDDPELEEFFKNTHHIFAEPIAKPSQLEQQLHKKRSEVFRMWLYNGEMKRGKIGPVTAVRFLCVGIFFLIWYPLWKIFLLLVRMLEWISWSFSPRNERIKNTLILLDRCLDSAKAEYQAFSRRTEHFFSGENINLVEWVEKHVKKFYRHILKADSYKKKFMTNIHESELVAFLDISKLENYIDTQFLRPLEDMLQLLQKTEKKITVYLEKVQSQYSTTTETSLQWVLKATIVRMEHQQSIIALNMKLLESWYEKLEVAKHMRKIYTQEEKE